MIKRFENRVWKMCEANENVWSHFFCVEKVNDEDQVDLAFIKRVSEIEHIARRLKE